MRRAVGYRRKIHFALRLGALRRVDEVVHITVGAVEIRLVYVFARNKRYRLSFCLVEQKAFGRFKHGGAQPDLPAQPIASPFKRHLVGGRAVFAV